MNKILMASAISKMLLPEPTKTSLGEQGSIEPLVKIFTGRNLEAKSSALGAICNRNRESFQVLGINFGFKVCFNRRISI
jgi:hypothetical protein